MSKKRINLSKKQFKSLVVINFLMIVSIYADFVLPSRSIEEQYVDYYSIHKKYSGYKSRGGTDITHYISSKSGNMYRVPFIPAAVDSLEENSDIVINKTLFLDKIKSIEIKDGRNSPPINLSFLTDKLILGIFGISVAINLLNIFYTNAFLDFSFSFITVLTQTVGMVYLFF